MALRKKQKDISQEKQSILRTARGRNGLMSTGMIAIVVAIVPVQPGGRAAAGQSAAV